MKKIRIFNAIFAISLVFSAVLTGCSSSSVSNEEKKETAETTPKEGGILTIARLADAENLDPQFMSTINAASVTQHKIYEGLVQRDKNSEIKPMLATEWKQVDDLTWEFNLRQGVTFHDGTPFTAEAVKKTFDRILDKEVASPRANLFEKVKEIKIINEHTVQFILTEPFSPLLSILSNHEGSIFSPKAIEKYGKQLSQHPVGTGPFTFQTWTPGQEIILVKNEAYWGEKPKVDKVVFKVIPEDATRIAMVETGEAHIAEPVPVTEVERVQSSSVMSLYRSEAFGTEFIGFNTKKKPFDDVRVRQAISHAIETDAIIKGVFNGVGTKSNSTMGPKVLGYNPDLKGYEYDINKAKALLSEAGYPNGFKTTILTNDLKERMNLAEVVQSQLKGIGIDVEVKVLEFGTFFATAAKGETDLFITSWRNATGDGDYNQYNQFHSKSQGSAGNYFFYKNPEVDKLIEEGRKEKDLSQREKIYAQIQAIEMKETPFVPIRNLENIAAVSKNVKGVWMSPSGYLMINEVTIQ